MSGLKHCIKYILIRLETLCTYCYLNCLQCDQGEKSTLLRHLEMETGWLSGISVPLYLLVIIFNLASWIDLNSLWTEMPLLVNRLPEGWELPAYFNLIINGAKIALIVYVILKKLLKERIQEYPFVYAIIVIGAVCLFMTSFFWDRTSVIGGRDVSLAILILTFLFASVDCLSSVVFLPYLSRFGAQYLTAFLVGEGICQLVPAVVGIIQGVGEVPDCQNRTVVSYNETTLTNSTSYQIVPVYPDPKFSVQAFFIMMSCIMVLSGVAFTLIHYLPYFKRKRLDNPGQNDVTIDQNDVAIEEVTKINKSDTGHRDADTDQAVSARVPTSLHKGLNEQNGSPCEDIGDASKSLAETGKKKMSRGDFLFSLVLITWGLGILFGLMPGTQSYSALPYGNRAYNLSLRLGLAVNPLVSFLALFVYTRSKAVISVLYVVGTAATVYQVVLACYSPLPPLKGTAEGEVLVVSIL